MTHHSTTRLMGAVAIATCLSFTFSGCVLEPAVQSKPQACQAVSDTFARAEKVPPVTAHPTKAADAISSFAAAFQKTTNKLTNPQVKSSAEKLAVKLNAFSSDFQTMSKDTQLNPSKVDSDLQKVSSSVAQYDRQKTVLGKLCGVNLQLGTGTLT